MQRTKPETEETLRQAARSIRQACPHGCNLVGALPCPACIKAVCRLLQERWLEAQRPERPEGKRA